MEIKKNKIIRDGITKKIYSTNHPDKLIIQFKNYASSADGGRSVTLKNKDKINNEVTTNIFKYLDGYHIKNHFIDVGKANEMVVMNLEMIPVQIIMWNIATGTLSKRFALSDGDLLEYPILEIYLKNKKMKNTMVNGDHICAFGFMNPDEYQMIDRISRKANAVLKSFFKRRGLKLAYVKLEYGRFNEKLILGDEITLDNAYFLNQNPEENKNRWIPDKKNLQKSYEDFLNYILQ